jgi:hypothetical protein
VAAVLMRMYPPAVGRSAGSRRRGDEAAECEGWRHDGLVMAAVPVGQDPAGQVTWVEW